MGVGPKGGRDRTAGVRGKAGMIWVAWPPSSGGEGVAASHAASCRAGIAATRGHADSGACPSCGGLRRSVADATGDDADTGLSLAAGPNGRPGHVALCRLRGGDAGRRRAAPLPAGAGLIGWALEVMR